MSTIDSSNYVLHAKSNQFYWEGNGQLSIKTFMNGKAHYKTNKGFFAVENTRYLLLNEGSYTISIEDDHEVESFCIFFKDGLAEEVGRSLEETPDKLLSDPYKRVNSIDFFEKTYQKNPFLSFQMEYLKSNYSLFKADPLWLDEQFHKMIKAILYVHRDTLKEVHSLKQLRYSTREEIYRRLNTAHDYIRAFYDRNLGLQEIAQVACLSPNHLLRNYSEIFKKTPHQHITELRISKAKQLLRKLDYSMIDIAFEIGFHNPVSFSKMFKQKEGLSPLQFRKKVILDKN
jgi:AraC family transcriptional regulator